MNIGFFYVPYYPLTHGRSVHGYFLSRALRKRGHQLLSCLGDGDPECQHFPRTRRGALQLARQADVLYIRIDVFSFLKQATLLKLLRPFALPVVWEVNAPTEELLNGFPPGQQRDRIVRRERVRRRLLGRLVNAAIGVSEPLVDYIRQELGIERAYCIPNGANPARFAPGTALPTVLSRVETAFTVCWAGDAATPWQGIDCLLATAEALLKVDPDVLFVVITGESLWRFPVLPNLLVLRQVPYDDMPHYLAAADAYLCLYEPGTQHQYGLYNSPLKLFDAMAAGKPIVASNLGQIARVLSDGVSGLLCANRAEEIASRILQLKHDPALRRTLGAAARQAVIDHYNWDRTAARTEQVLLEAVAGHGRS